jgi:hypothetical protein
MSLSREEWCNIALKVSLPVLEPLAKGYFYTVFPDKSPTARLEAFSRVLLGLSPWIERGDKPHLQELALKAINNATNPTSLDVMNFSCKDQVLVECAFLAQSFLRSPIKLWKELSPSVKKNVINCLKASRSFQPHDNNWVLFPSMVETFFLSVGEKVDHERLTYGIKQYSKWYSGDGIYNDGEEHHADYYNSFIIQPMLLEIMEVVSLKYKDNKEYCRFYDLHRKRLQRYSVIQERSIAPDGSFPPIGRSLTYRCGAFHVLALAVLKGFLSSELEHGQVRVALSKVIKSTLQHPDTFESGWLTKGLYGKQPSLAEPYINIGSLYMCCTIFVPLGLAEDASFWTDKDCLTTWEQVKNGQDVSRDRPYVECERKRGQCV